MRLPTRGATCYLNSLIQVMYMSPELRQGLFSIDPMELGLGLVSDAERFLLPLTLISTVD